MTLLSQRAEGRRLEALLTASWAASPLGATPARRGERGHGSTPRHKALSDIIAATLAKHAGPGDPFPSERELSQALQVSRSTLRQAVDTLVSQGQLERVPGLGTFVPRRATAPRVGLHSFSEDMRQRGLTPSSRVLRFESTAATGWLAREMGVEVGSTVVYLQRLLLADGEPMAVDENYLPASRLPGLERERAPHSLYDFLRTRYGVSLEWGEDQVEAIPASLVQARLLGIEEGAPLLQLVRHAFAGKDLMNYSACFYRADRYRLSVPLTR